MSSWYDKHQRSRAAVDAKQKASTLHQHDMRALRDASWEKRALDKVSNADIHRRIASRKESLLLKLQGRRHRLAQLLQAEYKAYNLELQNSIETDEQRRQRMIEQARTLQEQREITRKEAVQRIRAEQFKDGLDEFRVLKSKAIKLQCHGGREEQQKARAKKILIEKEEGKKIHKEYMKISVKMLEREIREAEELAANNAEMKRQVAVQVAEKKLIRKAQEEEKKRDVEAWRAALAEANLAEVEKQRRIHEAKEANVKEMFRLNAINKKLAEEKELVLKAEEARYLKARLEEERKEKELETAHTAEKAKEAKMFQAFLKSRCERQDEDESELEQVLKDENERAWGAREAVWEEDRQKKLKLKAEVAAGMAGQVLQRHWDNVAKEEEKQRIKAEAAARNKRLDEAERLKNLKKEREVAAYRDSLKVDIQLKKERLQKEVDRKVVEQQKMAEANATFDAQLQSVMGSSYKPPEHYRKKKVQWYF